MPSIDGTRGAPRGLTGRAPPSSTVRQPLLPAFDFERRDCRSGRGLSRRPPPREPSPAPGTGNDMISRMTDEVTVDVVELRRELSERASRMAGTEREKLLRSIAAIDWPPPGLTPGEQDQRVFKDHRGRIPEASGRAGRARPPARPWSRVRPAPQGGAPSRGPPACPPFF